MSLRVYLSQNNNEKSDSYGRYYAYADNSKPIGIGELAKHMNSHGSPFSEGTIRGILTDAVSCIRELALGGQPVKLDNLAIFSAHIENHGGWADLTDVDLSMGGETDNIRALRLCAQATGSFTKAELTAEGSVVLNRDWREKVTAAKKAADQSSD